MPDTNSVGYMSLAKIKYELRESFEKIKTDPMNLNLLMEHIAVLTGAVDVMSRYLSDVEDEREHTQ